MVLGIGAGGKVKQNVEDRVSNVKRAVTTLKNESLIDAGIGLASGFGKNNRKLIGF